MLGGGGIRALLLPRRAQSMPLPTSPLLPPQGITGEHRPCPFPPSPCSHLRVSLLSTWDTIPRPDTHPPHFLFSVVPCTPSCSRHYTESQRLIEEGSSTQLPRSRGPQAFQTVLTCWEPCQPAVWAGQGGRPWGLISCAHSASQCLRLSTPSWDTDCPSVLCLRKGSMYKCLHLQNPEKFPH